MPKWDYLLVDVPADAVSTDCRLKELGATGWELVQVLDGLLWLKRAVMEA